VAWQPIASAACHCDKARSRRTRRRCSPGVSRLAGNGVAVDAGETLPSWWGGPVDYAWEIDWLRAQNHQHLASAAG
jgi:hypothetical protein